MAKLTYRQNTYTPVADDVVKSGGMLSAGEVDSNFYFLNADVQNRLSRAGGTLTGPLDFASPGTIASASTCNIGSVSSNIAYVTGTTNITSFGTATISACRVLMFSDTLTITNSASLVLPFNKNMVTQAGDVGIFVYTSVGWKCISYNRDTDLDITDPTNYLAGDKTWKDLATAVRAVKLVGYASGSGTITTDDTSVSAIGKLQGQISAKQNVLVSGTNIRTVNGTSLVDGGGDLQIGSTIAPAPTTGNSSGSATVLSSNTKYFVNGNTSSGKYWALPYRPTIGTLVEFIDLYGNWANGPWTITGNGANIMGLSSDMLVGRNNANFKLMFTGWIDRTDGNSNTNDWRLV